MKPTYPVKYVTKAQLKAHADISLSMLSNYPNAGPNPNITGMRRLYWGYDSCIIKHGRYAYKVPYGIWASF